MVGISRGISRGSQSSPSLSLSTHGTRGLKTALSELLAS